MKKSNSIFKMMEKILLVIGIFIIVILFGLIICILYENTAYQETPLTECYSIWHGSDGNDVFGWTNQTDTDKEYLSVESIQRYASNQEGIYLDTSEGYYYFSYKDTNVMSCKEPNSVKWKGVQ